MAQTETIQDLANSLMSRMISARHWHDASFINMPLVYPSGSFVTIRLTQAPSGIRVSDSGFAYQEADEIGAGRSFSRTAQNIATVYDVSVGKRSIFVDVPRHEVERAIFDVSAASHAVAERIVTRSSQIDEATISDALRGRLDRLFHNKVDFDGKIAGASATEWEVSAIAKLDGKKAVFQAVTNYAASIYKTSTAFHDLAALDDSPLLVSVISSKKDFGTNVGILAQAGRVIEIGQNDNVYMRAIEA